MERLERYLDKKYILKSGRLLYFNHMHYNNDTLTDEIAEKAIKKFPNLEGRFISERDRKVLETKISAKSSVEEVENSAKDEKLEKEISALIESGEFEQAKEQVEKLNVEKTKEKFLKEIEEKNPAPDPAPDPDKNPKKKPGKK